METMEKPDSTVLVPIKSKKIKQLERLDCIKDKSDEMKNHYLNVVRYAFLEVDK